MDFTNLKLCDDLIGLTLDNFLDWSKFKAFVDDKINVPQKQKYFLGWVENIVGKGENAGHQHFLLFRQCFQKASLCQGHYKSGLCGKELNPFFQGHG